MAIAGIGGAILYFTYTKVKSFMSTINETTSQLKQLAEQNTKKINAATQAVKDMQEMNKVNQE